MHTFEEVRFEINIEEVTAETLNGVVEWKNMHSFTVLDIETLVNVNKITELDSQVVASNFVHLDLAFLDVIGGQANENCISPLLSPAARDQLRNIDK